MCGGGFASPVSLHLGYGCAPGSGSALFTIQIKVDSFTSQFYYLSSLSKLEHQKQNRNHRYLLWQTEKNVLPIFSEGMFMEKVNYIHQNPVRAGWLIAQQTIDGPVPGSGKAVR